MKGHMNTLDGKGEGQGKCKGFLLSQHKSGNKRLMGTSTAKWPVVQVDHEGSPFLACLLG